MVGDSLQLLCRDCAPRRFGPDLVTVPSNADAGIVYKTDAAISRKLKIAFEITDGPPITYPAAVLSDSRQPQAARKFLAYLAEKPADEIFRKFGFSVID